MLFRASNWSRLALTGAATVALLSAQRFSDPDTLAPAFPTPQPVVERMLAMAKIKPGEQVYDLGCGDGRIVIAAAKQYQAKAVGIEIRRDIYDKTAAKVALMGLADQVKIVHGNALRADLTGADVVTLYLLTSSNERLKPLLESQLKPTARVVSHDFEIHGWKATSLEKVMVDGHPHSIYLYLMSAR